MRDRADILLDKPGHCRFRACHDHVAAVLDRIPRQGFGNEVDADMRIALQEFRYQRRDNPAGIPGSGVKTQGAERPGLNVAGLHDKFVEIGEQLKAAFEQLRAGLGQGNPVRRAVQQRKPERILELAHVLADDRRCGSQVAGCMSEAAPFRHAHESVEFVQVSERWQRWHFLFRTPKICRLPQQ
jgi:hypothetical protein